MQIQNSVRSFQRPTVQAPSLTFGKKPAPEVFDFLVVGGGLSGLASADLAARSGYKVLLVEQSNRLGGNTSSLIASNGMRVPNASTVIGTAFRPDVHDELMGDWNIPLNKYPVYPGVVFNKPGKGLSFDPFYSAPTLEEKAFSNDMMAFAHGLRRTLGAENLQDASVPIRQKRHLLEWEKLSPSAFFSQFPSGVTDMAKPWMHSDAGVPIDRVSLLATMFDIGSYLQQDRISMLPGGNNYIAMQLEDRLRKNPNVTIMTGTKVLNMKDTNRGSAPVQLAIEDADGNKRNIHAKEAHLAVTSKVIPKIMTGLKAQHAHTLSTALQQGPYAIVGLVLNSERKGLPTSSSKFHFFNTPASKLVTDVVQINGSYDQNAEPGTKLPSVLVCYAPIPPAMWGNKLTEKAITAQVLQDVYTMLPAVKKVGVLDSYIKYHPQGILSPRKGDVALMCDVPEQLTPHVRGVNSTMSALTSSAMLALAGPVEAFKQGRKEGRFPKLKSH